MGKKAYRLRIDDDEDEDRSISMLAKKMSRLHIQEDNCESEGYSDGFSDSDEDGLSYTQSPAPDDTKCMLIFNTIHIICYLITANMKKV